MKKKLAVLLAASVLACGTAGILCACNNTTEYKPGDSIVDKRQGSFIKDADGNLIFEKYDSTAYSVKYLVNDSSYVTLSGEKPEEMVIDGYVGDVTELSLSEIEKKLKIDKANVSVVGIADGAFSGCETLETVDLNKENMSLDFTVGSGAFENCTGLTTVSLPEKIYTNSGAIGSNAFKNNISLTEVTLGEKVNEIGRSAFENCSSLISITIPQNVTVISESTFAYCDALNTLTVNEGKLKSIQSNAFYGTGISSLDLSKLSNLRYIGPSAFENTKLSNVNLAESITYIGNKAFYNCKNLSSINIPFLGNSIANASSFGNIYGSRSKDERKLSVTVGSVATIPEGAFANAENISSVTISSFATPGAYSIYGADGTDFYRVDLVESDKYEPSYDYDNPVYNSSEVEIMKSVGANAFSNCKNLTSVTLPSDVEFIGYRAFEDSEKLSGFRMPSGVVEISNYAFNGCTSLYNSGKLVLPSKLEKIGVRAFYNTGIGELTLPASLEEIGNNAFAKNDVTSLTIGRLNGLKTEYSDGKSGEVTGYSYVSLPSLSNWLGASSDDISQNNKLKSIKIESAYTLPANMFAAYTALQTAEVAFTAVNEELFNEENDKHYDRPSALPETAQIGSYAFGSCIELTTLTLTDAGNSVKKIGSSAFDGCAKLGAVTIPAGVEEIGSNAFYYCSNLTSVTLPATVKSIGRYAFANCTKITSFTVPANVTSLDYGILANDSALKSVTIESYSQVVEIPAKENDPTSVATKKYYSLGNVGEKLFRAYENQSGGAGTYEADEGVYVPEQLKTVTINGVCTLTARSFLGWKNLTTVNISFIKSSYTDGNTNLTAIGERAFEGCKIATLNITDGSYLRIVGQYAFKDCALITSEQINKFDKLTTLASHAYDGCLALTEVNLPATLEYLNSNAFYNCPNITTLNVGNYGTVAGRSLNTFFGANIERESDEDKYVQINGIYVPAGLETVTVSGLTSFTLDKYIFSGMTTLKVVALDGEVKNATAGTFDPFEGCKNLIKVYLPEGIDKLYARTEVWGNGAQLDVTVYVYSSDKPTNYGNYWHTVSNEPKAWTYTEEGTYTFDLGGATIDGEETKEVTVVGALQASNVPAVENGDKVLVGWYDNRGCDGYPVEFPYYSETKTTLYAMWADEDELIYIEKSNFDVSDENDIYVESSSTTARYAIGVCLKKTVSFKLRLENYYDTFTIKTYINGESYEYVVHYIDDYRSETLYSYDLGIGDAIEIIYNYDGYNEPRGHILNLTITDYTLPVAPARPAIPQFPTEVIEIADVVGDIKGVEISESKFQSIVDQVFGGHLDSFTADADMYGTELKGIKYDYANNAIHGVSGGYEFYIDVAENNTYPIVYMDMASYFKYSNEFWVKMYDRDNSYAPSQPVDSERVNVEDIVKAYKYDEATGSYWARVSGNFEGGRVKAIIVVTVDAQGKAYLTVAGYINEVPVLTFRYYDINNTTVTIPQTIIDSAIYMNV